MRKVGKKNLLFYRFHCFSPEIQKILIVYYFKKHYHLIGGPFSIFLSSTVISLSSSLSCGVSSRAAATGGELGGVLDALLVFAGLRGVGVGDL